MLGKLADLPQRRGVIAPPQDIRTNRRVTPDEAEAMTEMYQGGATLRQVGTRFGFHRETVSLVVQSAGVETRYQEKVEVDLEEAERLHRQGMTLTGVAAELGIGRTTLIRARRGL